MGPDSWLVADDARRKHRQEFLGNVIGAVSSVEDAFPSRSCRSPPNSVAGWLPALPAGSIGRGSRDRRRSRRVRAGQERIRVVGWLQAAGESKRREVLWA